MKSIINLPRFVPLILLAMFCSCGGEDDTVTSVSPQPGDVLQLCVSAGNFMTDGSASTRAMDNGSETTFESGDLVGVTILAADGTVIYNNVPYKCKKNGQWAFYSGNSDNKTPCYYDTKATGYVVYYPYNTKADGVTTVEGLKTIFPPQTDQSSEDAYRASDLLVTASLPGSGSAIGKTLTATLTHAYASVSLSPKVKCTLADGSEISTSSGVSGVQFTISDHTPRSPYPAADGSFRYILPADFSSGDIRCSYISRDRTYSSSITISTTVTANTRYHYSTSTINIGTYSLDNAQVGDFYCKNAQNEGYLIPADVSLTEEQQKACIGIVYSIDPNRIGTKATEVLSSKGVATPHGLVMALTNASEGCQWGEYGKDENSGGMDGAPFKENTRYLKEQYNNVDGYGETHWIINTYGSNGNTALRDTYAAFYYASLYGTEAGGTEKYAVPADGTTSWFIPGIGQWWDILSNLGGVNLDEYKYDIFTNGTINIPGAATATNNINKYLQKISDATQFNRSTKLSFWSSSESSGSGVCCVIFEKNIDYLSLGGYRKDTSYKVRCSFAF